MAGRNPAIGERPTVFGGPYSVYVRAVCLALEEKGVAYELVPVGRYIRVRRSDRGALGAASFGKIPAFEHAGFCLYEAEAITRYIDEAFAGLRLQPEDVRDRARMTQIISVLGSYAYRTPVWDIYVERVARPATGSPSDKARVAAALPRAEICLSALAALLGEGPWLAGSVLSLADLHAAPMFAVFRLAPEAERLLIREDRLVRWWDRVSARPSFARTQVPPRHASPP